MNIKSGVTRSNQELLYEILFTNLRISRKGRRITFIWIPAHVGIQRHEKVDRLAKEATKKEHVQVQIKSLTWYTNSVLANCNAGGSVLLANPSI